MRLSLGRPAADLPAREAVRVVDLTFLSASRHIALPVLHELDALLDRVEAEIVSGQTSSLVVRLGAAADIDTDLDLEEIRALPDRSARVVWAQEGQRVLRRIERLPVPTVAVLSGRCYAGAVQIALACRSRLAVDVETTRIGFPEASLGVLPGWGGTVRLPRLIGVRSALDLLLSAEPISARRALASTLVDRICRGADAEHEAIELVTRGMVAHAPAGARRGFATRLLEETAPGRRVLYSRARKRQATLRELPDLAADRVVRAVAGAVGSSLERSFSVEAEAFAEALSSPPARGSLHSHLLVEPEARAVRQAGAAGEELRNGDGAGAAVLGGGVRGAFYADLLVSSGYSVALKDVSGSAGRRSAELVRARLSWASREGEIPAGEIEDRMSRLVAATGYGGFGRLEVVVETALEDAQVKREVLAEAEEHVIDDCLLVVTSPIVPLGEVAPALKDPSRLVGLHLLPISGELAPAEVVRGTATSAATLDRACDLARRLGRVPILVRDVPGLVLPRLTIIYVAAAEELLALGATAVLIDRAMREFGMPVGPFELAELLGRGALEKAASALAAEFDDRFVLSRPPEPVPDQRWTVARVQLRIVAALVNEASRILDEGVIASARELDLAAVLGLGFPRERGGLLFWADSTGTRRLCELLTRAHPPSPLMAASPLLERLGDREARFYDPPDTRTALDTAPARQ